MNINELTELIEKQKKIVDEIQSIESFIRLYRDDESNEIIGDSFGVKYIENNGIIGISIMSNLDFAEIKQ